MLKLATFVVDPRFESDSLILRLYGEALGPLADVVKTGYRYILKAAEVKPKKAGIRVVIYVGMLKQPHTGRERQGGGGGGGEGSNYIGGRREMGVRKEYLFVKNRC